MRKKKWDRLLFWQRPWTPSSLERGRETKRGGGGHLPIRRPEGLLSNWYEAGHQTK